ALAYEGREGEGFPVRQEGGEVHCARAEGGSMIRLSVTDLDGYLYWLGNEAAELSELITRLRGQEEPTVQMRAGRAFHKVFEESKAGEIQTIAADGFTFDFAIDRDIAVPDVRELKGEIVLPTHVGPVTLVGKVDALNGATV